MDDISGRVSDNHRGTSLAGLMDSGEFVHEVNEDDFSEWEVSTLSNSLQFLNHLWVLEHGFSPNSESIKVDVKGFGKYPVEECQELLQWNEKVFSNIDPSFLSW